MPLIDREEFNTEVRKLYTDDMNSTRVMTNGFRRMRKKISNLQENTNYQFTLLNKKVDTLETDVKVLKEDMIEVKADIKVLKADMIEVKADIKVLKADMIEVKADIKDLKSGQLRVENKVDDLTDLMKQIGSVILKK